MYLQTGNFENQSRGLSIFARDMKCWGVGNDYSASLHADGRPFRRTRSSTDASGLCPAMKARSSGESPLMSFVSTHFAVSSEASSSLSSFTFAERPPRFDPILRQSIKLSPVCRCSKAMHQRYAGVLLGRYGVRTSGAAPHMHPNVRRRQPSATECDGSHLSSGNAHKSAIVITRG
jgi:hypothetical protein